MKNEFFIKREQDPIGISLEDYLLDTRILSVKGLEGSGDPKNIYEETFAEETTSQVYISSTIADKSKNIEIVMAFFGENCYVSMKRFKDLLRNYEFEYWDTYRNLTTKLVWNKAPLTEKDFPYEALQVKYTFKTTTDVTIKTY